MVFTLVMTVKRAIVLAQCFLGCMACSLTFLWSRRQRFGEVGDTPPKPNPIFSIELNVLEEVGKREGKGEREAYFIA